MAQRTDLFKLQEIVIASADPKVMPDVTTVLLYIISPTFHHSASALAVLCTAVI
jgi:hypothetical protein